jgi:hypothetical protein
MIPQPGNPVSWDRFSYCFGNPVRYIDPSGHMYTEPQHDWTPPLYDPIDDVVVFDDDGIQGWSDPEKWRAKEAARKVAEGLKKVMNSGKKRGEIDPESQADVTLTEAWMIAFGGPVVFYRSSEYHGNCGYGGDPNKVTIYNVLSKEGYRLPNWFKENPDVLIHELGHVFFNDHPGIAPPFSRDSTSAGEDGTYSGFAGGTNKWQYSMDNLAYPTEQFADMFLGWTYGGTFNEKGQGPGRKAFMNKTMALLVARR